jgi:pyruvate dehydrogenase E1 component alpha subunit
MTLDEAVGPRATQTAAAEPPGPDTARPALGLPVADPQVAMLRGMLRIRRFEEACAELYSAGRIRGFLHLCIGEEAVAVGVLGALAADDPVVSTYREHGHALARGMAMPVLFGEMFGRRTGCSRGRGGSMHLFDRSLQFYGGNAIVGGGLPIAAGLALAARMQGDDRVVACLFGDGAMAEGEFHETANLAALWHLPILFCCENNQYAMGTALNREHANTDLALRAASYPLAAWAVDGMDPVAVNEAARRAVGMIRGGGGPCFLELRTYRFRAHSMYDPELYRDKAEVAAWRRRDPIPALAAALQAAGRLSGAGLSEVEAGIAAEIADAIVVAEAAPPEADHDLLTFVRSPAVSAYPEGA